MVTCIFSGPTDASDAATETLSPVGNTPMASRAVPENTIVFSVSNVGWYTTDLLSAAGPFSLKKRAEALPISEAVLRTSNPPVAPDAIYTRVLFCVATLFTSL